MGVFVGGFTSPDVGIVSVGVGFVSEGGIVSFVCGKGLEAPFVVVCTGCVGDMLFVEIPFW